MLRDKELLSQFNELQIENNDRLKGLPADDVLRIMMEYRCAIMEIETKLNVLNNEFAMMHNRNPIQSISTRLKQLDSITEKLDRKGFPVTIENMETQISDIAGVRVICSYPEDIYIVADQLLHQDDIRMLEIKDYLKHPKSSGYRSLHLIVEIPIFLSEGKKMRKVEIQCRTIAMDFWASVEHQLKYKKDLEDAENITRDLRECAEIISNVDYRMQGIRQRIEASDSKKAEDNRRMEEQKTGLEKKDERILRRYESRH